MFTGIVETIGEVMAINAQEKNLIITISSPISRELKVDQSISHNGVCLTVIQCDEKTHQVLAVSETLTKTNLGSLQPGSFINLERCMKADGRFDGHIVQGHVDTKVNVKSIENCEGSWKFTFAFSDKPQFPLVEKGSVCINGVSLTCFDITESSFSVAIIPFTYEHTTFKYLDVNDSVNIEFDILGKYMTALFQRQFASTN